MRGAEIALANKCRANGQACLQEGAAGECAEARLHHGWDRPVGVHHRIRQACASSPPHCSHAVLAPLPPGRCTVVACTCFVNSLARSSARTARALAARSPSLKAPHGRSTKARHWQCMRGSEIALANTCCCRLLVRTWAAAAGRLRPVRCDRAIRLARGSARATDGARARDFLHQGLEAVL
jgi:hypothetical protein